MQNVNINARHLLNEWLGRINPADPSLVLDKDGCCMLQSTQNERCLVLVTDASSESFHLLAELAPWPEAVAPKEIEELFALNFLHPETRGAVISLDKGNRNLVLSYSREIAHTDIRMFCKVIDQFLDVANAMRKRLPEIFGGKQKTVQAASAHRVLHKLTSSRTPSHNSPAIK